MRSCDLPKPVTCEEVIIFEYNLV